MKQNGTSNFPKMNYSLSSLPPGESKLRITHWRVSERGELQILHESTQGSYRHVWKTFKDTSEIADYFSAITNQAVEKPSPELLDSILGTEFLGTLKTGRKGFMNLIRVEQVLKVAPPIFNSNKPVKSSNLPVKNKRSKVSATKSQTEDPNQSALFNGPGADQEKERPNARQIVSDLS